MTAENPSKNVTPLNTRQQSLVEQIVREYEPQIRGIVRFYLAQSQLRRHFDSSDIYQSVLAHFMLKLSRGALKVDSPEKLKNLLLQMAIHKIFDKMRRPKYANQSLDDAPEPTASGLSPSQEIAQRELIEEIRAQLSEKDWWLVEQRAQGRTWPEIAAELGEHPASLRILHTRALLKLQEHLDSGA
jgi:RNA polymerase sigma factor (sigma-70 family)